MTTEPAKITESVVEQTTLAWFESLGYNIAFGPDISPDGPTSERHDYDQVVRIDRFHTALKSLNPTIPADAIDEAVWKVTRTESPSLIENNRRFHLVLTDGVDVSHIKDGREVYDKVWLLDLDDQNNNDWLAVNQFTVTQNHMNRRLDILVFVNGLPLAVVELKNHADENATLTSLRDALLLKFISGELRVPDVALELVAQTGVPDADKLIEEVGV
jgi:type I restriction enzyme R subunit